MTSIYGASPAFALLDRTKGSMTNRYECSKEHLKNNLSTTAKVAGAYTLAGAGAYVAIKQPKMYLKVAKKVGDLLGKSKFITKKLPDVLKRGKIGLAVAAGTAFLVTLGNIIQNHAYKSGQIDQKYTDAAKIESQTKNVVLA